MEGNREIEYEEIGLLDRVRRAKLNLSFYMHDNFQPEVISGAFGHLSDMIKRDLPDLATIREEDGMKLYIECFKSYIEDIEYEVEQLGIRAGGTTNNK